MSEDLHNPAEAPRVLAVGDIITDAFIKLSEDYAQSYTDDKGYKRLSFELGAKLPYGKKRAREHNSSGIDAHARVRKCAQFCTESRSWTWAMNFQWLRLGR